MLLQCFGHDDVDVEEYVAILLIVRQKKNIDLVDTTCSTQFLLWQKKKEVVEEVGVVEVVVATNFTCVHFITQK